MVLGLSCLAVLAVLLAYQARTVAVWLSVAVVLIVVVPSVVVAVVMGVAHHW